MKTETKADEFGAGSLRAFRLWRMLLRYVAPVGVGVVLAYNLF